MAGKIIVLEGCDGSGKDTQMALLKERLDREGKTYKFQQFHNRTDPTGQLIDDILKGNIQGIDPKELSMECLSTLFAENRRRFAPTLCAWRKEGQLILLNRHVESNIGFQLAKIDDTREKEASLKWLEDLEYKRFGIPRSDAVLYLHLTPEIAAKRKARDARIDLHDRDIGYQKKVEATYAWIISKEPQKWQVIEGLEGLREKSITEIHEEVYGTIKKLMHW